MLRKNAKNQVERRDQKQGYKEGNVERRSHYRYSQEKEVKAIWPYL